MEIKNHKTSTYNRDFCEKESCSCDIKDALYVIADKLQLIDQRLELANMDITEKLWDDHRKVYRIYCQRCKEDMSKATEYLSLSDIKYSTCEACISDDRRIWIEKGLELARGDQNIFNVIKNKITYDDMLNIISDYVCHEPCQKDGYIKGMCPIHDTLHHDGNCFVFNLNKNIFFCTVCQKGGDIISFIALVRNISQIDAASCIATKLNLWEHIKEIYQPK